MLKKSRARILKIVLGLSYALVAMPAFANLANVEAAQQRALQNNFDQFLRLTQEKDVMGKPMTAQGEFSPTGEKARFNSDNKLSYTSRLTDHKNAFNVDEEVKKDGQAPNQSNNPNQAASNQGGETMIRRLFAWVSGHGAESEGGGASILEQIMYKFHSMFSSEEQKKKDLEQQEKEEGTRYTSAFKIETREVFKKEDEEGAAAATPAANQDPDEEPEKVDRSFLRDEVKKEVDDLGTLTADAVARAATTEDQQDDPSAIPNGLRMREAARRGIKAAYDSALASLGQRNAYKAIKGFGARYKPKLNEDRETCQKWAAGARQDLAQESPGAQETVGKEIDRMLEQCEQVVQLSYNEVAPKFESDPNSNDDKETLKSQGPEKEDNFSRDLRNQLSLIRESETTVKDLETNWEYTQDEGKNKVVIEFDENGQPKEAVALSPQEQMDLFDAQQDDAKEAYQLAKEKNPTIQYDPEAFDQYKLRGKNIPLTDIAKIPDQLYEEDYGVVQNPEENKLADSYIDLIKPSQDQ